MKYAAIIIAVASLVVFSAASSALACGGCWGSGWSGDPGWTGPGWQGGPAWRGSGWHHGPGWGGWWHGRGNWWGPGQYTRPNTPPKDRAKQYQR